LDFYVGWLAPEAVISSFRALRTEVHTVNCLSGAARAFRSPGLRARFASPSVQETVDRMNFVPKRAGQTADRIRSERPHPSIRPFALVTFIWASK